jgi:hypothetical protein
MEVNEIIISTGNVRKPITDTVLHPLLQCKSNKHYISVCVSVALGIQHVMHVHYIVIDGLSGFTNFSTLSHKRLDFRKKSS